MARKTKDIQSIVAYLFNNKYRTAPAQAFVKVKIKQNQGRFQGYLHLHRLLDPGGHPDVADLVPHADNAPGLRSLHAERKEQLDKEPPSAVAVDNLKHKVKLSTRMCEFISTRLQDVLLNEPIS